MFVSVTTPLVTTARANAEQNPARLGADARAAVPRPPGALLSALRERSAQRRADPLTLPDQPGEASGTHGRIKVVSAWPAGNVGDGSQSTAIAEAARQALTRARLADPEKIDVETLEINGESSGDKIKQLEAACRTWLARLHDGSYEQVVFVLSGSGDGLAPALGNIARQPGFTTIFSGHQLSIDLATAPQLPALTALPESGVTAGEQRMLGRKTKLVLVSGVAHGLTDDEIARKVADYQAHGSTKPLPKIDADTVAVILGGDAPDESGRYRFFSETDARILARSIAEFECTGRRRCLFVVTNGPRTGKFDRYGVERSPNPHRVGEVDSVTQAFVDQLGRESGTKVELFDFQFGRVPSAYAPMIDAFRRAGPNAGHVHVPGESTSMVTEVTSVLPKRAVIDEVSSMNGAHRRHVSAVIETTGVPLLRMGGGVLRRPLSVAATQPPVPAAEQVADALVAHLIEQAR